MAFQASLKDFTIPDIFQMIGMQKKTGILTTLEGRRKVIIHFHNGNVTHASEAGSDMDLKIGRIMVKSGMISEDDLNEASAQRKNTKKKLGQILIKRNIIDHETLKEMLRVQTTQIIYKLFQLQEGKYSFDSDAPVSLEEDSFAPIPVQQILMEGMRIIDEWPAISKKISSLYMVFKIIDPFTNINITNLGHEERQVYKLINNQNSVQDIIDYTRLPEFEVFRALYNFMQKNSIEENKEYSKKIAFNVDFVNPFLGATIEVIESMTKVSVTSGKPRLKKPFELARGDISGVVGLTGEKKGSFSISFSKRCVLKVVSNMLGTNVKYINIQVREAVGELTNIIAREGRAKLSERGFIFHTSISSTIVGDRHFINHNTGGPCIAIPFNTETGPFFIEVSLEK